MRPGLLDGAHVGPARRRDFGFSLVRRPLESASVRLNAFLRPLLMLLSLPLLIVTLGFFTFIINATLLYFVGQIVKTFHVASFGAAFWGGLVISLVSLPLNLLTGTGSARLAVRRGKPPEDDKRSGGGDGPVIDV